jgi:hypothetical protein
MCRAFSCVIGRDKKVTWKFGTDSHEDLIEIAGYSDDTINPQKIEFCRVEVAPKNGSYLDPDEWVFKIDMDITPAWWTLDHKTACCKEFEKWKKKLYKILIQKEIVHPFKLDPPEITEEHIQLLREWNSVMASVRDSVRDSVWDSVGASVGASVRASVRASVMASVMDSVWDSFWDSARVNPSARASVWALTGAYTGSFFKLKRSDWKYTDKITGKGYPFTPAVKLWDQGLVPSFDGKKWRLHGGPDGKILWEGEL